MSGRHAASPADPGDGRPDVPRSEEGRSAGTADGVGAGAGAGGADRGADADRGAGAGGADAGASDAGAGARPGRLRVLLLVAIGLVVVVAAVVVYLLVSDRQAEPEVPEPITTTLPVPTAQGEAIEPTGDTPLAQALPTEVLDHVLTAQAPDEDAFVDHQGLEGWFLTYSAPGSDIEVHVLQWEDAQEAVTYAEDLLAQDIDLVEGEGRRSGDVAVDGDSVGRYEIGVLQEAPSVQDPSTASPDDADPVATPEPLGPGAAVWTNGTVAVVATGDAARLAQFYDNFPF